uniref:Uncharacterized protein n=1 Tax=Knipowitschia caucasica TaxID=637954 RepID=A0AAV2KI88_KNICA
METPPQDQDLQISITAMATPPLRERGGEGEAEGEVDGEVDGEGSGEVPVHRAKRSVSVLGQDVGDQGGSRSQIWGDRSGWGQEEEVLEQWQRWWLDRHTRDQMMVRKLITPGDTEEQEDQNNPGVMRKIYEEFDISCCPLVYYGQRYQRLYVSVPAIPEIPATVCECTSDTRDTSDCM